MNVSQTYAWMQQRAIPGEMLWMFDDQSGAISMSLSIYEGGIKVYGDEVSAATLPIDPAIDALYDVFVEYVGTSAMRFIRICFHQDGMVDIWDDDTVQEPDMPLFRYADVAEATRELQKLVRP